MEVMVPQDRQVQLVRQGQQALLVLQDLLVRQEAMVAMGLQVQQVQQDLVVLLVQQGLLDRQDRQDQLDQAVHLAVILMV